jgi:DNA-directed RNA polymerase specialized sigma24 family protein
MNPASDVVRKLCLSIRTSRWLGEAFWELHRNPPPSNHNLAGWLYRPGIRLALDHLKKRKGRAHYEALACAPAGTPCRLALR